MYLPYLPETTEASLHATELQETESFEPEYLEPEELEPGHAEHDAAASHCRHIHIPQPRIACAPRRSRASPSFSAFTRAPWARARRSRSWRRVFWRRQASSSCSEIGG